MAMVNIGYERHNEISVQNYRRILLKHSKFRTWQKGHNNMRETEREREYLMAAIIPAGITFLVLMYLIPITTVNATAQTVQK